MPHVYGNVLCRAAERGDAAPHSGGRYRRRIAVSAEKVPVGHGRSHAAQNGVTIRLAIGAALAAVSDIACFIAKMLIVEIGGDGHYSRRTREAFPFHQTGHEEEFEKI